VISFPFTVAVVFTALQIASATPPVEAPPENDGVRSAREVVRETVDEVLGILRHQDWTVERRVDAIEDVAYARFDFPTISRLVLARSYRRFSPEQRREFVGLFKSHLSHSYGSRVDRYGQEKVEIVGARREPRGDVTVITRVVGGDADGVEMHYRLRKRDQGWKVIDVVIEGVSLVSNYRSQFKEVVNRGGPDELLERLRDKTAEFDAPS